MRKVSEVQGSECQTILNKPKGTHTDIGCDECEGHLVVREGYSRFLGCSNFPKCKSKWGFQTPGPVGRGIMDLPKLAFEVDLFDPESSLDEYPMGLHCSDDIKHN